MEIGAIIGAISSLAGSMVSAMGAQQQAEAQAAQLRAEAIRQEQQAGQERAASQHKAAQIDLDKKRLISQQNAAFAASGGGVLGSADTVMDLTAQQGQLNQSTAMYEGEAKARSLEDAAAIKRAGASAAESAGQTSMAAGIIGGLGGFAKASTGIFGNSSGESSFRYGGSTSSSYG